MVVVISRLASHREGYDDLVERGVIAVLLEGMKRFLSDYDAVRVDFECVCSCLL